MSIYDKLLAAHHPDEKFVQNGCDRYYNKNISILHMRKSKDIFSPLFRHSHPEYEFMIPNVPIPVLMHMESVYFGEVGYVYPADSNCVHGTKFQVSDASHDNVVVDKEFIEDILKTKGISEGKFHSKFPLNSELKSYIQLFKNEFSKGIEKNDDKMDCIAKLIVHTLIETGCNYNLERYREPQQYQKGISKVVEYLNQNYYADINIKMLADMCGLTQNYFITSFKKAMGESPYSYVNKLRISKAKVLLETTEYNIQEISQKCGFKKANTFTSLFKSVTGRTPKIYRGFIRDNTDMTYIKQ